LMFILNPKNTKFSYNVHSKKFVYYNENMCTNSKFQKKWCSITLFVFYARAFLNLLA